MSATEKKSYSMLGDTLRKLDRPRASVPGLSAQFFKLIKTEQEALALCEGAMRRLGTEYVDAVNAFMEAKDARAILMFLNSSEEIWAHETAIISHLDKDGQEKAFLKRMRANTLRILEQKLAYVADACYQHPQAANVAACLGLLGTLDCVLCDLDYSEDSPERLRVTELAQNFR